MPYLRLTSLPLDDTTKRHLADELTATVLDVLTDEKPEWTTVHFTPFDPTDVAVAGRLVADGAIADTHLELSAPGVDEKHWFALRNRLTDVLVDALAIDDADRWHVNVKLNRYDAHSFAVAGNAADDLDEHRHLHLEPEAQRAPHRSRRPGWRAALFAGLALGALTSFRWLSTRLASDVSVDAASPEPPTAPRTPVPAAPPSEY